MPCVNCVDRCEYNRVVKERDELKHANICFKAAYEHEHGLAQQYFEQAAELQRNSNSAEARYSEAKARLEARYNELEKLRKENESVRNNLRDLRGRILDANMENEALRRELKKNHVALVETWVFLVADKRKKEDVRAKPEQSQRRAKRGKAKPHQKGK